MTDAIYMLKLESGVSAEDAAIAKHATDTSGAHPRLNEDLTVIIERKDTKDMDQFAGRFFVKIVSDPKSDELQQQPGSSALTTFNMLEEANAYWFADAQANIQDTSFTASAPSGTSRHMVEEITTGAAGEPTTTKAGWEALLSHADINDSR